MNGKKKYGVMVFLVCFFTFSMMVSAKSYNKILFGGTDNLRNGSWVYKNQVVKKDLNGDGKTDKIKIKADKIYRNDGSYNCASLSINGKTIFKKKEYMGIYLGDIDARDRYIEIIIRYPGSKYVAFRYNGCCNIKEKF